VTLKRKKAENAKLMEETATHRTERRIGKDNLPTFIILAPVCPTLLQDFSTIDAKSGQLKLKPAVEI
jgi:hypothetical protein